MCILRGSLEIIFLIKQEFAFKERNVLLEYRQTLLLSTSGSTTNTTIEMERRTREEKRSGFTMKHRRHGRHAVKSTGGCMGMLAAAVA